MEEEHAPQCLSSVSCLLLEQCAQVLVNGRWGLMLGNSADSFVVLCSQLVFCTEQ